MECWTTFQLPGGLPQFISLEFSWKSSLYTMDEAVFELDLVEDMLWTDSSFEGKWNSVCFGENLWENKVACCRPQAQPHCKTFWLSLWNVFERFIGIIMRDKCWMSVGNRVSCRSVNTCFCFCWQMTTRGPRRLHRLTRQRSRHWCLVVWVEVTRRKVVP